VFGGNTDGKTQFVKKNTDNATIISAQQALERLCAQWVAVTTPAIIPAVPVPPAFPDGYDNTDLDHVCVHGDLPALVSLIAQGTDIRAGNDTALRDAADNGHTALVQLLLDHGADIHADTDGALRWAADSGHIETVQLLLSRHADIHADDDAALIHAAMNGHQDMARLLLENGADCQTRNNRALQWATQNDNLTMACILAEGGVPVEKLSPRQQEAFMNYKENQAHLQQQSDALKKSIHTKETLSEIFKASTWVGHRREMQKLWGQVPLPLQSELDFQHCLSAVTLQTLKQHKPNIVFTK
jgi:hypothetical protein